MTLTVFLTKTTVTRDREDGSGTLVSLSISGNGDAQGTMTLQEQIMLSPHASLQAMKVQALKQAVQRLTQLLQASAPPEDASP